MCGFSSLKPELISFTATSTRKHSSRTPSWRQRGSWTRRRQPSSKPLQRLLKVTVALPGACPLFRKRESSEDCDKAHTGLDSAHTKTCKCQTATVTQGKVTFKYLRPCCALSYKFWQRPLVYQTCKYMYGYNYFSRFGLHCHRLSGLRQREMPVRQKHKMIKRSLGFPIFFTVILFIKGVLL